MKFTPKQYAQALHGAFSEVSDKEHEKIITNFVFVLQKNHDLPLYEKIVREFEKVSSARAGETVARVTTAGTDIKDKEIVDVLNGIGKEQVKIQKVKDESILGGVIIKTEDTLIDASLRTRLEKVKNYLANAND